MTTPTRDEIAEALGAKQDDRGNNTPRFAGLLLHPLQAYAIADAVLALIGDNSKLTRSQAVESLERHNHALADQRDVVEKELRSLRAQLVTVRQETLEEAAQIAEQRDHSYASPFSSGLWHGAQHAARAIRALVKTEDQENHYGR